MKYLLILLFSFNSFAQIRVEIKKDNESTMELTGTKKQIEKHLKRIVRSQKRFKGHWDKFPSENAIFKRRKSIDGVSGLVDDALEFVGLIKEDDFDYFVPDNFSIVPDPTYTEKETKRKSRKTAKDNLRNRLNSGEDLTLKELNNLLRN